MRALALSLLLLIAPQPALPAPTCISSALLRSLHDSERREFEAEIRRKEGRVRLSDEDLKDPDLVRAALALRMHLAGFEGAERLSPAQLTLLQELKDKPLKVSFGSRSFADFATGTAVLDRSVALRVPEKLAAHMRHELTHLLRGHRYSPSGSPPGVIFLSEVEANLMGEAHGVTEAFHVTIRNNYGAYLVQAHGPVSPRATPYEIERIVKSLCAGPGVDRHQFPAVCGG